MADRADRLWIIIRATPRVDATELSEAMEEALIEDEWDYRTRLLVRDAAAALEKYWGPERFGRWAEGLERKDRLYWSRMMVTEPDEVGFPSLMMRVMDVPPIDPSVDLYELFVDRLFSTDKEARTDLMMIRSKLEQGELERRVRDGVPRMKDDHERMEAARVSWWILYDGALLPGEKLSG